MRALPTSAIASLLFAGLVLVAVPSAASAQPASPGQPLVATTFRLVVHGRPPSHATFWAAYGPLAGRFGIVQMHRSGSRQYAAAVRAPAGAESVFSLVMGIGRVYTRAGWVPGNPVTVIRVLGRVTMHAGPVPLVDWNVPVG